MLTIIGAFSKLKPIDFNSNGKSKDHWSETIKADIAIKTFEILWQLSKCDAEMESEQMLLEKADRHVQSRVATN